MFLNNNEGGAGEGGGAGNNELEASRIRARYQQYIRIGKIHIFNNKL